MNQITSDSGHQLIREFEAVVPHLIKPEGIYPLPMMVLTGRGIDVVEMKVSDRKAYEIFCKASASSEVLAAVFGRDCNGFPEQKVELDNVLACVLYEHPNSKLEIVRARDCFRYGIIEYHDKPRVVRRMNWQNQFWIDTCRSELSHYVPPCLWGDRHLMERVHLPANKLQLVKN